jgi:Na+/melibiose symporter-like transporter
MLSQSSQEIDAKRKPPHYTNGVEYGDPRFNVTAMQMPPPFNGGGVTKVAPNMGWIITLGVWIIGSIFAFATFYSTTTEMRSQFSETKRQVDTLQITVSRIDERQQYSTQILKELRDDVRGIRRNGK